MGRENLEVRLKKEKRTHFLMIYKEFTPSISPGSCRYRNSTSRDPHHPSSPSSSGNNNKPKPQIQADLGDIKKEQVTRIFCNQKLHYFVNARERRMRDERLGGVDGFTGGDRTGGEHTSPGGAGLSNPDRRRIGSDRIRSAGGTSRGGGGGGEKFREEEMAKIRRRLTPKGEGEHRIRASSYGLAPSFRARSDIYGLTKPRHLRALFV